MMTSSYPSRLTSPTEAIEEPKMSPSCSPTGSMRRWDETEASLGACAARKRGIESATVTRNGRDRKRARFTGDLRVGVDRGRLEPVTTAKSTTGKGGVAHLGRRCHSAHRRRPPPPQ